MSLASKILIILFSISTGIALFLYSQELLGEFILPIQFGVAIIAMIVVRKMKDLRFKLYIILHFLLLGISTYLYNVLDDWHESFLVFVVLLLLSYIPILIAGLRRNKYLHALSLLRQHPWISAVLMGLGYFAYKYIGVVKGPKEIPVILSLAFAVITLLFLFERSQKVTRGSFFYMLFGALAVFGLHVILLKSTIARTEDWMNMVAIFLAGASSCFLIMGSFLYEAPE